MSLFDKISDAAEGAADTAQDAGNTVSDTVNDTVGTVSGGSSGDSPDPNPTSGPSGSGSSGGSQSRQRSRQQSRRSNRRPSRQDNVDQEIQQIIESDATGVSGTNPGPSGYAGQESATDVQRDLPQTGVQEAAQNYRRRQAREGEQFGDIDWPFGLERKAEELQKTARKKGDAAGNAIFGKPGSEATQSSKSWGEAILDRMGKEEAGDRYDSFIRSAGRGLVSEPVSAAGSVPKAGLEAAEAAGYTAANPKESASKVPGAAAAAAVSTANAAEDNPGRLVGGLVGGAVAGSAATRVARKAAAGKRSGSLARTRAQRTPSTPRRRSFAGDNRGQMTIGDVPGKKRRGDGDSGSSSSSSGGSGGNSILPDNIDEMLNRAENAQSRRDANKRAEQNIIEKRLEEGRRQERGDEPRTVDTRPGGDYTAPDRGGDFVASRSPDTSRSGPTNTQSSAGRSGMDTELSPRESQLASKLGRQTPEGDLRGFDATSRAPSTDLRAKMSAGSRSRRTMASGAAGATASDSVAEMGARLEDAQQPEVTAGDTSPPGTMEDTSVSGRSGTDSGALDLLADAQSSLSGAGTAVDNWLDMDSPTTGTTDNSATGTQSNTDSDSQTGTIVDTPPITDTPTDTPTTPGNPPATPTTPPRTPPTTPTTPTTPIPTDRGTPDWTRRNFDPEPESDQFGDFSLGDRSSEATAPRETDRDLEPGWLSETITTIGTMGKSTPDAPSQSALKSQPFGLRATGNLPTAEMLSGNEGVQKAADLFSFGSSSGGSSADSGFDFGFGSDDKEEGWFL